MMDLIGALGKSVLGGGIISGLESLLGGSADNINPYDAANQSADIYNMLRNRAQPSINAQNQVAKMQQGILNKDYLTGLRGSTIEQQALGRGEADAFNSDINNQVAGMMGLMPTLMQQQGMAQQQRNALVSSGLNTAAGLFGDYLSNLNPSYQGRTTVNDTDYPLLNDFWNMLDGII